MMMAFESHSRNLISILPSCTFVVYGHPPLENDYLPVTNSVVKVLNSFVPSHSQRYVVGHYDGSQQQAIYYYLPRSNVVRLITVGTDPTHGYNRFVQSASSWHYRVLGFGDQWNGGNMAQGPGGGKKILYLQEYLKQRDLPEYIVFTDCYDVVVLGDEAEVMETYQQHFDGKLVFGAEAYCWPDKDRSSQYPPTASMFKYLNSGLFMGPTKLIQELLATASVAPTDDDQRFYTTQFLQQSHPIVLDYNGVLFQNLAGTQASDFTRFSDGRVANKNGYRPCFLHGNGPGLPVLAELREEVPDIRVFLQRYQHEDIIYIPNPGNAGDSLIAFGTIQLFNELGLRWVFGSATGIYHDKVLFYAGGGNLVGLYDDCKIFLQNNKDNNNRIVVLPHTIKSEDVLIKSLDSNVILFCRERTSFQYVHRLARHKQNVYLSKDMAFYIQNIDKYKIKQNNTQKVCHAFRMDCEQTNISIPDDNIDLSHHLNMPNNTQTNIEPVSMRIFEYLSKFDVVRTNRLHICIAGHLLGKTVHFYPNSYYKNKAVYDYSLRDDANVLMSPKIINILEPVVDEHSITYTYLYNHTKYSFTNTFLSNEPLYEGIEGVIALFVPHSILTGARICSEIPVDKAYIDNLQHLVPVFRKWHNNNNLQLHIDVPTKGAMERDSKKTIATFTLGVDSFYTLYSNRDTLDAILFVIGFDIKLHQKKLLSETIANLKTIATLYDKKLILCETDLKNKIHHGKGFEWGEYWHGPALFNVMYSLNNFKGMLIPSTHLFNDDYVWGSQYKLDKHYSSSFFNIVHHGDLTRVQKIKFMLEYDLKCLRYLRVCWQNLDGKYNCTKCEKCLRTLYPIELYGCKDHAVTFNRNVDGKDFWKFKARNKSDESFQQEIKHLEKKIITGP